MNDLRKMAKAKMLIPILFIAALMGTTASFLYFGQTSTSDLRVDALNSQIHGTFLSPARPLVPFTLKDQWGKDFNPERLRGVWTLLFFGYTHCPDFCPQSLTVLRVFALAWAKNPMPNQRIQVVFVSVDPNRDNAKRLGEFTAYFQKDFIGVTGTAAELNKLTRFLGFLYEIEKKPVNANSAPGVALAPSSSESYDFAHSVHIALINPQAEYQAFFRYPHEARKLLSDFKLIISQTLNK